jgi:hypothetical protein
LSTLAVMKPGPSTARNSRIRKRHAFQNLIAPPAFPAHSAW